MPRGPRGVRGGGRMTTEKMLRGMAAKLAGVDVDALLRLSNEMGHWARACDMNGRRVSPTDVCTYARRIREACGVML